MFGEFFPFNLRKTEAQTKQNDHLILLLKESSGLFNLTFSEKLSLHTVRLPVFSVGLERAKDKKEARLRVSRMSLTIPAIP